MRTSKRTADSCKIRGHIWNFENAPGCQNSTRLLVVERSDKQRVSASGCFVRCCNFATLSVLELSSRRTSLLSVRGKIQSHTHTRTQSRQKTERRQRKRGRAGLWEGGRDMDHGGAKRGKERESRDGESKTECLQRVRGGKSGRERKRWKAHAVIWASGTVEERWM